MFKSFFRMCKYIVKPDSQDLTAAEEEFVFGLEGVVIGFVTALVAFRFAGHALKPLIGG